MRRALQSKTVVGALLVLVALGTAVTLWADCNHYSNSRVAWIDGQNVCGFTGPGCTECTNEGGGSCVTDGSSCEPFNKN